MRGVILFSVLLSYLFSQQVKAQMAELIGDTVAYKVLYQGPHNSQNEPILLIKSDKEYFDYYYARYGTYPKNFRFDFERNMILLFTISFPLGFDVAKINYILETNDKIIVYVKLSMLENNALRMWTINNFYSIRISLKRSDKEIVIKQCDQ